MIGRVRGSCAARLTIDLMRASEMTGLRSRFALLHNDRRKVSVAEALPCGNRRIEK